MRGADQQQNHIFSYVSPEERVRKDHPLRTIRAMVDVASIDSAGTTVASAIAADAVDPQ